VYPAVQTEFAPNFPETERVTRSELYTSGASYIPITRMPSCCLETTRYFQEYYGRHVQFIRC